MGSHADLTPWHVATACLVVALTGAFLLVRGRVVSFHKLYDIHKACDKAYRARVQGNPIVRFLWVVKPLAVVVDPRKASRLLNNDATYFDYTLPVFNALWGQDKPMLMSGNAVHKQQRKHAAFLLTPDFAEHARASIKRAAERWLASFDDGEWHQLDIDNINKLTWAMLSELTTGADTPDYRHTMLAEVHNARTAGMVSTVFPGALPIYAWLVRKLRPEFHQWERLVRERIAAHRAGERVMGPIIAKLVDDCASDEDVFGVISALHVAGHHAPSAAITFAIYHLLCDEAVMAQTMEHMDDSAFLTQVLHETVRLYPGGVVSRFYVAKAQDDVLGVSPGEMLLVPWYSFHRDAAFNQEPLKFHPERKQATGNFFPFGLGAHSCIGQRIVRPMFEEALRAILGQLDLRIDAKTLEFHAQLVTAEPSESMHKLMWAKRRGGPRGRNGHAANDSAAGSESHQ